MMLGTLLAGLGISSLPYVNSEMPILILGPAAGLAIGNALFSPTQSSVLTSESIARGQELGMIMGAQEGSAALARIFGPLFAALIWSETVEGSGMWTFHTCFRVAGLIFCLALLIQFKLKPDETNN